MTNSTLSPSADASAPSNASSMGRHLHMHRNAIGWVLCFYLFATWVSMAGMEIFGWIAFLLTASYAFRAGADVHFKDLDRALPWKSCLTLFAITIIGVTVNGTPKTEYLFDIGSQRWMFLLATLTLALTSWPPTLKGYRVFLVTTSIIAVYAVFQSLTGIDLMRPGSNRAVQPLNFESALPLWRSAGFFGSPLQYAYIVGQHVCLPLAFALLYLRERKKTDRLFYASLLAYALISLSLITTFTRGAWLALCIAQMTMVLMAAPRLAGGFVALGAAVFATLFSTVELFRARILSLFDPNYASNTERLFLWKANLEMFRDYPIFGIGYQENENRAGEYVARLGNPDAFTGHAHSNYIQMLSGTGITGFLCYMFIISFMLWLTWRLWKTLPKDLIWPRALALACFGAQLVLHIGGLTECNFKAGATNHNLMVVWALVGSMTILNARGSLRGLGRTSTFN